MKKVLVVILLLWLTYPGTAQTIQPTEYHFNRLSVKNGLPEDVIMTIMQDREGFMWIGTQAGVVRYDGYTSRVYQFGETDLNRSSTSFIFEDHAGVMWVGTWINGLYRYNRETDGFTHYQNDPGDSNSIAVGQVAYIQDDNAGNIWMIIAALDGKNHINWLDTKTNKFHQFGNSEKGDHFINASEFTGLLKDGRDRIWVSSDNGIYEYDPAADRFIPHFASSDPLRQKKFTQITADPDDPSVVWMATWNKQKSTGEGVWRYNSSDNTTKSYRQILKDSTSLGNDSVFSIQKDSKGRLWFGSFYGLSVFQPVSNSFINYTIKDKKAKPWELAIFIICEDKEGNFWCGNQNKLFIFSAKTKTFSQYIPNEKNPEDVQANGYSYIMTDHSGTPWIGTAFQGVNWLNRKRSAFTVYKNAPGQPHFFPGGGNTSFAENKDGSFWIWSANGLYRWYPSSDSFVFVKEMGDQGEKVAWHFSSIAIDRQGLVWCNTFGKGVKSYNPETHAVKNYEYIKNDSTSPSNKNISTLYEDKQGILWVGTFGGGICSFDPQTQKFTRYPYIVNHLNTPSNNALDDAIVFRIYEDKQGTIWVGTNIGGLNKFNRESKTFTSYQNQSPGLMTLSDIFEDGKGQLWVGTHESGLFLFDRTTNTGKKFGEKDGLLYDGTLGINEDNKNNLWVLSQRGISVLNHETNSVYHIVTNNGLPEEPENNLNFFKAGNGRFLFPINNGFIAFDPDQLKPDTTQPVVHIESIEIPGLLISGIKQNDSVIYTSGRNKIDLHYNENRISINYIGLQYQNSILNQYAYKLDGYDKEWIQAGTQRKVTYTNLSPGTYTFHVKAANGDGVWNPDEQTFVIIISPPWWLTWWAYVFYALLATALIGAFVDYRAKSLKRENIVLEEKISLRTNQLKQSIEDLKSTQAQLIQSEKMASLGELTAGIAHEIQNPLNFVNNFSDVNTELLTEMKEEMGKGKFKDAELIAGDIIENEKKINHHGKRADAIVKSMLMHSRSSSSAKEPTNINALTDEYLRLAYHGLRARDNSFNVAMQTDFDTSIGKVNIMPQEIGRVLLNLINNAFYAVAEKKKEHANGYEPMVSLTTKKIGDKIEIVVRDNGNGIPQKVADKIFHPFFTTKPAGQGTGLGLSLSYDIVKAHGGEIKVETKEGKGTLFTVVLPGNI